MSRKYTKKSDYWKRFKKEEDTQPGIESLMQGSASTAPVPPSSPGEPYYESSTASSRTQAASGGQNTNFRRNAATNQRKAFKYSNIAEGSLPYRYGGSYITPRESIVLCQKAYANIPIFRNAIDVMSEFANSDVHLSGGNEKSRRFVEKWLEKIQIWRVKDQYFREYYRSGNVFMYKLEGKFGSEDLIKLSQVYGSKISASVFGKIPIAYIFLNPYDFVATRALAYKTFGLDAEEYGVYKKMLSEYDIERLRDPKNAYDKEVFDSLPAETKKQIKEGAYGQDGVLVKLDPKKLIYSFYKKQDYEPFAIPFGFPVLDDLNWKLELKKVDQAITRTIENVILLITMGASPDKGGINQNNLQAMQQLFRNESIGRALIADWTTKAEFVIPDMNKVLGPEKYQIVNEDIREGLQNIIVGKENYSSTQVKAQIFLERLKEARNGFMSDFLQPQIKQVCQKMGFRDYPRAEFVEIDIKDEVQLQRVATRLMELGIITPEQGMIAMKEGIYPRPDELEWAQEKFVDGRKKGYYVPIVSSQPFDHQEAPESAAPDPSKKSSGLKQKGRPTGSSPKGEKMFARHDIQETIYKIEDLCSYTEKALKSKLNKKRISKEQRKMIGTLSESVIMSTQKEEWKEKVDACIKDFNEIESLDVMDEVLEMGEAHQLASYPAAILYHSSAGNEPQEGVTLDEPLDD